MSTKEFMKVVEWSARDRVFIGSLLPHIGQCCHGKTEKAVYEQLAVIAEDVAESCARGDFFLPDTKREKECSGKFMLRIAPALHKAAYIRASQAHKSLNAFVEAAIEKAVHGKPRGKAAA